MVRAAKRCLASAKMASDKYDQDDGENAMKYDDDEEDEEQEEEEQEEHHGQQDGHRRSLVVVAQVWSHRAWSHRARDAHSENAG